MTTIPLPFHPYRGVRIVGAGSFVPSCVVDNARIAEAIPGWPPERIEEKTGIRERRFLWDFDAQAGVTLGPPAEGPRLNVDMCEVALRRALEMAGLPARDLDAVFLVTCTPDRVNFSHDAMELHRRLGCREGAYALMIDDGCGGTPYVMDMAYRMIRGGAVRTAAVIGASLASPQLDRAIFTGSVDPGGGRKPVSAFLSYYVFGDGAGAVVLRGDDAPSDLGIVASTAGNDHAELVLRRATGNEALTRPPPASPAEGVFVVDGQRVAESYPIHMRRILEALMDGRPELAAQVRRYYFHQPNKRLVERFVDAAGIPADRVAVNVDRYGNTSAAGMLILLAEDIASGAVELGRGDLVAVAAVGANVHYGGQLVRL